MPKSHTSIKVFGALAFRELLEETPDTTTRFVRSEMWRFTRRVRAKLVRERLKGRPGIKWRGPTGAGKGIGGGPGGKKRLGKNVKGWVEGDGKFEDMVANVRISRLLRVHEEGEDISARKKKWLIIRDPKNRRKIVARVKRVRVPPRLRFRETFTSLEPDAVVKIDKAMQRASDALTARANKKAARALGSASGAVFAGL